MHRILVRGGVFSYPFDAKHADKHGKLRLMYEANPMSLLIEQAGGLATDAVNRILDIEPTVFIKRAILVLGAKNEVEYVKNCMMRLNEPVKLIYPWQWELVIICRSASCSINIKSFKSCNTFS